MRGICVVLWGLVSGFVPASDLPEYPKLHAAINAHLLAEKENYFGAVPFKPVGPSEYRPQLIDLNGDGILNVLDVVVLVNLVLTVDCPDGADINNDGVCNVLDVVILVNLILR